MHALITSHCLKDIPPYRMKPTYICMWERSRCRTVSHFILSLRPFMLIFHAHLFSRILNSLCEINLLWGESMDSGLGRRRKMEKAMGFNNVFIYSIPYYIRYFPLKVLSYVLAKIKPQQPSISKGPLYTSYLPPPHPLHGDQI